jgi:hypothetical protein
LQDQSPESTPSQPPEPLSYNRVAASNGSLWLRSAWQMFTKSIGVWLGIVGFMLFMMLIPGINYFFSMLMPLLLGGLMLGCSAVDKGQSIKFDHLFDGLKNDTRELLILSALYGLGTVLVNLIALYCMSLLGVDYQQLLIDIMPQAQDTQNNNAALEWAEKLNQDDRMLYVLLGMLILLALMIPLFMALWFAPALVVLKGQKATTAFRLSFNACKDNFIPFLVYGLFAFGYLMVAFIIATIVAVLVPVVGVVLWLVMIMSAFALSIISAYTGFRNVFNTGDNVSETPNPESESSMIA